MKLSLFICQLVLVNAIACNTLSKKNGDEAQGKQYSGLVGSCSISKSDLKINLCLEYSYSAVATSDPKQDSVNKLQSNCAQSSPPGNWQTDGTCSPVGAAWTCNSAARQDSANAFLKMIIGGEGASQASAKTLCDGYNGTLTPVAASISPVTASTICSRDLGNGYISYEIAASPTATVKRWFIISGNAIHDRFDSDATYDPAVARWKDYFFRNNFSLDQSVVYEVDGKQTISSIKDLIANRCP